MPLTDEQKKEVAAWIAEGAKLSEVQERLAAEYDIRLTYMEARFLADDLAVIPKDKEPPKTENKEKKGPASELAEGEEFGEDDALGEDDFEDDAELDAAAAPGSGKVQVSMDQIVRPGSLVSGRVTLSDGVSTEWYIDQMGRFGLVPPTPGYQPSPADLAEFRVELEKLLSRHGGL